MSLIHRHPGTLNPKVHYRSPFFDEDARRAERETATQRETEARARAERQVRRDAFAARLGLSLQRARTVEALHFAGTKGLSAYEVKCVAQCGQVSTFLADLSRTFAVMDLWFAERSGAYRAIYRFTPATLARLDAIVSGFKDGETGRLAGVPETVRILPESDAGIIHRHFDVTARQACMIVALHCSGATGETTAALCKAGCYGADLSLVKRLTAKLDLAGVKTEFSRETGRWRLTPAGADLIAGLIAADRALVRRGL